MGLIIILFVRIVVYSIGTSVSTEQDMIKRWMYIRSVIERDGPLADPGYEINENVILFVMFANYFITWVLDKFSAFYSV